MSFHLSSWSIKNPVPTIVAFLILGIVGIISFLGLGINDSPNIDVPVVIISVTQRGVSPTELETQVTKKIEDAVANLDGIDELSSTVTDGSSRTVINFDLGVDSDRAVNEVRNAISEIRPELPQDIDEPSVTKLQFTGGTVITYAVVSQRRTVEELSNLVDLTIIPELLNVKGVGQIERLGGLDREIRVDLDPERLQAYGITATEIDNQIARFNINLSGGRSEVGGREQNVRTLGSAKSVRDLRAYPIELDSGDTVPLSNFGEVTDNFEEPRQKAFLNGEPVVSFGVKRSLGSTDVAVEEAVRSEVTNLETILPEDVRLKLIFTSADSIRASYQGTIYSLVLGCLLTVLTVGLFLRDWRVTLITATALPLSIIPTFWVMKILGYTLNSMSLLALALAVGNLVDDAICMIENIDRHLQMKKKPFQAALDAAREIGLAVVATTATIVAVFIPVAFMGGIPGQYFQPFGVTVAVSTMFSTLVACTVTPMLSAYLLKPKKQPVKYPRFRAFDALDYSITPGERGATNITYPANISSPSDFDPNPNEKWQPYRFLLNLALRNRIATLILAAAFFFGSLQLIPYIPKGLFDSGDTGVSTIQVELPPGSQLERTEAVVKQLDRVLRQQPAVASVLSEVGEAEINTALLSVNLVPKTERDISQREFQDQMREVFTKIPGARISFQSRGAGGSDKDVSLILRSNNPEILQETANNLEQQIREIPGLVEVTTSTSLVKPEIIIEPNPQRAADLGVSVQDIASTASLASIGNSEFNLPKFNLPDRQIPIRVQIDPAKRRDIATLKNLYIPSRNDTLVPLEAVASIRLGSGPATIERFNRNRQVTVEGNLQGISLGDAIAKIRALPALQSLPPAVTEEPSGDAEIMREVFSRFASALGLAILCIYAILVLLYNNFVYPMAILAALPLSVGGALLGLLITQKELGLFALIGIVLLMGLVTKNAILLVDFALSGLKEGKTQRKAVIAAGVSRLRPILMTSISTVAGMMPIALEFGADGEVRSPMAIAVIGGFTTSTLLTLVVVPVLFTYVDGLIRRVGKFFGANRFKESSSLTVSNK
ncbi:efflux RND transporter permease subunit [Pleurocapsales cyanobacterium LEGE 10410]|nr:efflux RND transporter permease subunit [Pleurocapsales cyanobacterium LEGE 10410]